jgi:hypothetical protein
MNDNQEATVLSSDAGGDKLHGNEILMSSHLLTSAFATIFVLGSQLPGGVSMSRELSRHLLLQAHQRFARNLWFIFLMH